MQNKEVLKFIIHVIPRSKKNNMRLIRKNGKTIPIPSKAYEQYENECMYLIPNEYRKRIDYPVNIKALYYVERNARIDKTNLESALLDMLVKANVISDDSALKPAIVVGTDGSRVFYDKSDPRIEIEITRM